ncbi:hypothetical protein F2Q69_00049176 [Brassica cretica]|uniref:Uncharacterized protein n=1 Tax=Brassica cretica TaxID=69181 RepID=A0A8S9Q708_BRACR|nr:hypothetical protein F2Q69_00049176 [Brassica cretica]
MINQQRTPTRQFRTTRMTIHELFDPEPLLCSDPKLPRKLTTQTTIEEENTRTGPTVTLTEPPRAGQRRSKAGGFSVRRVGLERWFPTKDPVSWCLVGRWWLPPFEDDGVLGFVSDGVDSSHEPELWKACSSSDFERRLCKARYRG